MLDKKEYWQCSYIRKCKWVGEYKDLDEVKNKTHPDINMTDSICPKCGNDGFYILNETEFKKLINKNNTKIKGEK